MSDAQHDQQVLASWRRNAEPWTRAVRSRSITSRNEVTDQAILSAIRGVSPSTLLDIGCGEGWLARSLSEEGVRVIGVDAVPELVARARALGGGEFRVCAYEQLGEAGLPISDVAVCNFSLIGKSSVETVFQQVGELLPPGGHFIVQTLHPVTACGELPYQDGWREGSWSGIAGGFLDAPPWYFRTLESWKTLFSQTGCQTLTIQEPRLSANAPPSSILFVASF